jgi:hypothetical protein
MVGKPRMTRFVRSARLGQTAAGHGRPMEMRPCFSLYALKDLITEFGYRSIFSTDR